MKKGLGYQIVNMLTAPQPKEPGIGSAKDRLILQKKKKKSHSEALNRHA